MSEYQYYEFQAVDRPLTEPERRELREPQVSGEAPRTAGELLAAADRIAEERAAAEHARREREKRGARERYLEDLARREEDAWRQIDTLIATKQPARYDEAVKLLCDLRDLAVRRGRADGVESQLRRLCEMHAKKPSFLDRLKRGGWYSCLVAAVRVRLQWPREVSDVHREHPGFEGPALELLAASRAR